MIVILIQNTVCHLLQYFLSTFIFSGELLLAQIWQLMEFHVIRITLLAFL